MNEWMELCLCFCIYIYNYIFFLHKMEKKIKNEKTTFTKCYRFVYLACCVSVQLAPMTNTFLIFVLTHCHGRKWVITNSNRCSLKMFHGNSLTFRYFSRRMSLRSVWQNFNGRLFSGSQINLCNSVCSNGLAYWFSGDWAMETVPALMLRGHAINMSWKTQLYFSRCWNYTMYSRPFDSVPNI